MTSLQPFCVLAVALAGSSLALSVAALVGRNATTDHRLSVDGPATATAAPVVPARPQPKPSSPTAPSQAVSLQMSCKELKRLCQQNKVHNARWRASARKTAMVRALHAAGIRHA